MAQVGLSGIPSGIAVPDDRDLANKHMVIKAQLSQQVGAVMQSTTRPAP